MMRKKVIFRSLTIALYSFAQPFMADVAFQTIYCITPHRGALTWEKMASSVHTLWSHHFLNAFFFKLDLKFPYL